MAIDPLTGLEQEDDPFGFGDATVTNSQTSSSPTIAPPAPPPPTEPEGPGGEVPDFSEMAEVPTGEYSQYSPTQTQSQYGAGLYDFGFQGLNAPSRFDIPLVQQGIDVINKAIDKQRATGQRQLAEHASSRGLIGSSVEADTNRQFEEELQRQSGEQMWNLGLEQARTVASDRALAASTALGIGQFGEDRSRYGFEAGRMTSRDQEDDLRYRAQLAMQAGQYEEAARLNRSADELARAQFGFGSQMDVAEFLETQRQFGGTLGLEENKLQLEMQRLMQEGQISGRSMDIQEAYQEAQVGLRAQELMQQAQTEGRTLDLQEARDQASQQIETAKLEEARAGRLQEFGLSTRELDQRAQQMIQQAQTEGRTLDLTEARDLAEVDYRTQQLVQQASYQGRTLDIEEARLQATTDIEGSKLAQQATQFQSEMTQREAEFAREYGLDERQFSQQQTEFSQTMAEQIAGRLQEQNQFASSLNEEIASRAMEDRLRTEALTLQKQGMTLDEAYRRASLAQEDRLQTKALELEELGILKEDAYKYAALSEDTQLEAWRNQLISRGQDLDASYRQAALAQESSQFKQQLSAQQQQFSQSAGLSQLDIILRALASGLEPGEISPYRTGYSQYSTAQSPYSTSSYGSDPYGFNSQSTQQFDPQMIYQLLQFMSQYQQPQQYTGGTMYNSYGF